jgi:DNA polymerase I-like protein with 3'-5' exonuclease and polymerase domains
MTKRALVYADWANLEGRLTAYFSKDPVLTRELEEELSGGLKVHSRNAALIYGCRPEDAKTVMVSLRGQEVAAYDGGKRLTHGFNYGMGYKQMAMTFWVSERFAKEAIGKLREKYQGVVAWREELADRVFGVGVLRCVKCGTLWTKMPMLTSCPKDGGMVRWNGWEVEPERVLVTPFRG